MSMGFVYNNQFSYINFNFHNSNNFYTKTFVLKRNTKLAALIHKTKTVTLYKFVVGATQICGGGSRNFYK